MGEYVRCWEVWQKEALAQAGKSVPLPALSHACSLFCSQFMCAVNMLYTHIHSANIHLKLQACYCHILLEILKGVLALGSA